MGWLDSLLNSIDFLMLMTATSLVRITIFIGL